MRLIEIDEATFGYSGRPVVRVKGLSLPEGRCLGVFGPNGSGKTTLARGMIGLLAPLSGQVRRREALRVGYLPQLRTLDLHWPMTGFDAAALAVSAQRRGGWISGQTQAILRSMRTLGVDNLARKRFAALSGGQQQRLLLAGALAADPRLLVLDEPTDGLDVASRGALLAALRQATERGTAMMLISHNLDDLRALAQTVAWVEPARTIDQPSAAAVLDPDAFTRRVERMMHNP